MALTRKFLTALGIDADKIDEIISAHAETVDALKEQRDQFKADAEALPGVKKELDDLKKSTADGDGFKEKYDSLKAEYDNYKQEQETKEARAKKETAYKALLREAGVSEKRIDAVLKVSDVDGVELDDSGKVKDASKLTESIKEEWSDFIVTEEAKGADTSTPPEQNGGATFKTKEEIMAIKDGAERRKAIAENPSLFGLTASKGE